MSLTSLCASITKKIQHISTSFRHNRRNSRPSRRPASFRPQVEQLEARELLSTAAGMNMPMLNDWSGAWTFTDAFKESRPWLRTTNGQPDLGIALDTHGNPVQLTTGQQVQTVMFTNGHEPSGTYTAWWQGDGIVNWGGDVTGVQLGTTGLYHTALLSVTAGSQGIWMTVTPSSASDMSPIHDTHVWMPDYNGQHFAGQIWHPGANFSPYHPLFLQRLAPFHNLRFMAMQQTDTSQIQHWSDRRAVDYETQQTDTDFVPGTTTLVGFQNGVAPEYMIELANDLHADMWINLPHMAQDDYVTGLASLVHNTLNPNQHVYLEWSNEVWNGARGIAPHQWIASQLPAGATLQDFTNFVAQHETHAFGVWSQTFADRPGQTVRVLTAHAGDDYYNNALVTSMNQQGGNYDAFSVAAYFGPQSFQTPLTVDGVVAGVQAAIPTTIGYLQSTRALANQAATQLGHPVAFLSYEGGPALEAQTLPPNDLTLAQDTRTMNQASLDPRIYGIYSNFLSQLTATGLDLLDNNLYIQTANLDDPRGLYGALNYQDQPTTNAPRYQALIDYINGTQPPPAPTPNQIYVAAAYQSVLGRPADAPGLAYWTAALNAGMTRTTFASALTHSPEYYSDFVTAAYNRYLGRSPDSGGLAAWVAAMQAGLTDERLEAGFLGSAEYIANHGGTGAGWVRGMYQDLLGRTPAQSEVDGWVQALADGMAASQVAYGFAASPERETDRVTGDYQTLLGRTPDAAGLASWVNGFLSGSLRNEDVVAGFVASDEYFSKHAA